MVRYAPDPRSIITYQRIALVNGTPDPLMNYIRVLFRHILGRNASLAELVRWKTELFTHGRLFVIRTLEYSAEGRANLVRRWFLLFLGRQPSARETAPFVQALLAGQSEEVVLGRLLGSPSASRSARVRGILIDFEYQDLFGRKPTVAERNAWAYSLNGLATVRMLLEAAA